MFSSSATCPSAHVSLLFACSCLFIADAMVYMVYTMFAVCFYLFCDLSAGTSAQSEEVTQAQTAPPNCLCEH